jgi:hypothetical protein
MKNSLVLALFFLLFMAVQINGQTQVPSRKRIIGDPEVPRISAYEAYIKFKAGKAIILHAGGDHYIKHHIMGAFDFEHYSENLDIEDSIKGRIFRKLPKEGIEIFTYCY